MTNDFNYAMNQFRLASRELFNSYFRLLEPYPTTEFGWLQVERFERVEKALLEALVLEPFEVNAPIVVQLRSTAGAAPVMINRELTSGYWDYPVTE